MTDQLKLFPAEPTRPGSRTGPHGLLKQLLEVGLDESAIVPAALLISVMEELAVEQRLRSSNGGGHNTRREPGGRRVA